MKDLHKGSIVRYKDGHYRISAVIAGTVNLASIFGSKIYFKRVPVADIVEDEENWYKEWQQSETYKCM